MLYERFAPYNPLRILFQRLTLILHFRSNTEGQPKKWSPLALVSVLAGGNLATMALRMIGGFMTARVIPPAVYGLFNGLSLIQGYLPFLQLGVLNGLNRELPYYIGKGEQDRVREVAAAAQAWALALGGVTALGLIGVAVWHAAIGKWALAVGWLANAVTAFFLFYGTYYLQVTFRTRGDFARLALINVIQGVVSLILVAVVWWLAFYGLCLRAVLAGCVQVALLWYWRPIKVSPSWNSAQFVHLLRVGAPIFAVGQLYTYWATLDSTLVLYYTGAHGLGLYTLVGMAETTLMLLPQALSQVLYPQMAEQYGRTGDVRAIVRSTFRPMILSFLFMLPVVIIAWLLVPPLIRLLLPKYVDAIPVVQWAVWLPAGMCLSPVINVYSVVRRQRLFATAILLGMAAYYFSLRWLLRSHTDLTAFPQAMLVGKVIFLAAVYGGMAIIFRQARPLPNKLRAE